MRGKLAAAVVILILVAVAATIGYTKRWDAPRLPSASAPASSGPVAKPAEPAAAANVPGLVASGAPSTLPGASATLGPIPAPEPIATISGASCAPPPDVTELRLTGTIRDFNDTHPDFEKAVADDRGIVLPALGPDRKPVYAHPEGTGTTHGLAPFSQWFKDVPGVNMAAPLPLTLTREKTANVFSYENKDFFPIDNQWFGNQGRNHNFHFTFELHTQFRYLGGEFFDFAGDDDVWVFINGKLAIDLGGVHDKETAHVDLDKSAAGLGIARCQVVPLDMFYAERHTVGSDLKISTSLALTSMQRPTRPVGTLSVTSGLEHATKAAHTLEIILDASGSMNLPLEGSTRWKTALGVFRDVLDKLPADFNVGLRIYGHRYRWRSPQSCTDSQLVVAPDRLDKARILSAMSSAKPRGDTPLVYSVIQAIDDLSRAGGDTVIVITDGEESCGGKLDAAVQRLKGSGVDMSVNIVGFTLAGKRVQQQLTQFTESTGGRYYTAKDGAALARALLLASIDTFDYAVVDGAGAEVAHGQAGAGPMALDPGNYTIVVHAGDETLKESITVAAGSNVAARIVRKGDGFAIQQ